MCLRFDVTAMVLICGSATLKRCIPEFVHTDPRDLGMEASSLRWKELHITALNCRLACLRVSKL